MKWYRALNRWADDFESGVLPFWLQYNCWGDPASWFVSHPAFTAFGALVGACVGLVQGDAWRVGAVVGAAMVALYYTFVREPLNAIDHYRDNGWSEAFVRRNRNPYCVGFEWCGRRYGAYQFGWLWDGLGDFVFCWLEIVVPLWLWLL